MRIGILGAARIARHVIVDPARRLGGVTLAAVAARDPERARAFAAEHGVAMVEADYGALLARRDLDFIYLPLINSEHARWAIAALESGHNVLCEKPIALNADEAVQMVAAAERAGRWLIEGFHYCHHALMRWLVTEVASGRLGAVSRVDGSFVAGHPQTDRTRWGAELGGGALLDLGCYPLHALRTLFGEPEVVAARAEWIDGVDATLDAELRFGAIAGSIHCSLQAERHAAGLRIEGANGGIVVENFVAPQLPHRVTATYGANAETFTFGGPGSFDAQLLHVRDVLAGTALPLTGGADAIANMTAIDAIFAKARA